jgi:RNA polymerase sigma-70 factor, ECF subfamily
VSQPTTTHKVTSLTEQEYQQQMLLVTRVKNNDIAAYEQLYREHVGRVYALCVRMVSNVAIAEELCQEVFVRVWQKIHSFRGESAFSSWLHRLAANVVLSELRKKRLLTTNLDELNESQMQTATTSDSGKVRDMEQAISQLPDGAKAIFVLHDIEGFKHNEIAQMLNIAEGTSKTQLHRARKLLKGWLK